MAFTPIQGTAKRLRIYIDEADQWRGKPLYAALLDRLRQEGLAGATVVRGIAGFGAHSRLRASSILDLSLNLPLIIEIIDTPKKIAYAVKILSPMVREGLITVEDVEVIAYTHRFLRPLPIDRPAGEVMTRQPLSISADQPILAAWERMLAQKVKALPVVDGENCVVGLLTHEDFMERAGLNARLAVALRLHQDTLAGEIDILRQSPLTAADVMSKPPVTVRQEDPLGSAAEKLVQHGITRLPVVDEQGRLVGMLSRLDVLRQVLDLPARPDDEALLQPPAGRLAGEVMAKDVPLVGEDTSLAGVIASFLSSGEHRVIVIDAAGAPVGLISDSDVVGRIQPEQQRGVLGALRGRAAPPPMAVVARDLMSQGVETITASTPIINAVQRMLQLGRKWLIVVDAQGKPVGMVDREIALEALVR